MDLFFKFVPGMEPAAQAETFRLLETEGARDVSRLFPQATDPDLKNHYVAAVGTATKLKRLIRLLRSREDVEFAHAGAPRAPRER